MSYNNQQNNNKQNDHMKEFAKNQGKKIGKKVGKLVAKKIIGAVGAKAAPILIGIGLLVVLVLLVIALFYPDVSSGKNKTKDDDIKARLTEYAALAADISTNVEWLLALDMAIHENNSLLDRNINDNAYHLFGLHYEKYRPERESCHTKDDGTESCRTIPEKILESVDAEGKSEILDFFKSKGLPTDDISGALNEIRSWTNVRLSVYGMPLDFAKTDAELDDEQIEYLDSIIEIGYIPEIYDEYGVSYNPTLGMGASISCSPTKSVNRENINRILSSAGVFNGYTDVFLKTAEKYGIDPVLFIGIALHETGRGTSNAVVNKNNPGGLMDPSTGSTKLFVFSSLEEGIEAMGKTLYNRIIVDGLTTIGKLGNVYAPVGASNDPTNLNQYWVSNVSDIVNSLGGLVMNCEAYQGDSIIFDGDVSEAAKTVATAGVKWIGNSRYVFGGGRNQSDISRGYFDCSSFVHWAYAQAGINLGSLSSVSTETLNKMGKKISITEIQVGDLIFWDTYKKDGHVGIYIGNGKFIGAQSSTGVSIVSLNDSYWSSAFNGHVRRLLN